jgi:YHS domain-containing protein
MIGLKLEPFRWYLLGGAFLFLAIAFWRTYRPEPSGGASCRIATGRFAKLTLWASLGMTLLSTLLPFLLLSYSASGFARTPRASVPASSDTTGMKTVGLAPWEPLYETFRGCELGCGRRGEDREAQVQAYDVTVGAKTYCPVSGVVFVVTQESVRRTYRGRTFFFCCEGCARHFDTEPEHVLPIRGINAQ